MQKAVGSSPIIRLYTLQNGIFECLFGQQMTFCTRRDEFSPSSNETAVWRPTLSSPSTGWPVHHSSIPSLVATS
jgi:hypothetical protein